MPFNYISKLIDSPDPVIVVPYGGYANDTMLYGTARVLEDEGVTHAEEDRVWKNLWNSYKRFETDELRHVPVEVEWNKGKIKLTSDKEGYVDLRAEHGLAKQNRHTLWLPITYRLLDDNSGETLYHTTSSLMKPGSASEFGVISDIDDTVLETGVASSFKWRLLVNSFMKSHYQRSPLPGAYTFYQLLHIGKNGLGTNPFFYLSNSPWNIHGYLKEFLRKHNFPKGPLLLRDMSFTFLNPKKLEEGNKFLKVSEILNAFPGLPFILIGDAAEHDIDIYLKIAELFPKRVSCIYLRVVSHKQRMQRVTQIVENSTGVEIKMIKDSDEAIAHARDHGYIGEDISPADIEYWNKS